MSEIRTYLTQVDRASLLRSRGTHPRIVELVRAFEAGGGVYDEDAEQYVERACGDLPPHKYHGHPERDPMTYTLGTAIYNARRFLDDEDAKAKLDAMRAEGYQALEESSLTDGARYLLRVGTLYVGRTVPIYGAAIRVRALSVGGGFAFMPHRARSRGYMPQIGLIKQLRRAP